jgi:membrane-bound lytic murein transglycosylase A
MSAAAIRTGNWSRLKPRLEPLGFLWRRVATLLRILAVLPVSAALGFCVMVLPSLSQTGTQRLADGTILEPFAFAALPGWTGDDHAAAFATLRETCAALTRADPALRMAKPPTPELLALCARAERAKPADREAARLFFEMHFVPYRIVPADGSEGFLTGYYEPEVDGSYEKNDHFTWPIYARPDDLVSLKPGETLPGLPEGLSAARNLDGFIEPYWTRADIEAGALRGLGLEGIHVADEVEAFLIHVQGSARVRLPDGTVFRLRYAGRNGHPYTSIGRLIVQEFGLTPADVTLEKLKAWLRADGERGRAVMRRNHSFIFFDLDEDIDPLRGPIGGAGVPLQAGRSLAVDRMIWSYGLPFFLDIPIPVAPGKTEPMHRLLIAQDTGSAILGAARGDLFFGSGPAAGILAGETRHRGTFYVLLPKTTGPTP